MSTGPVCSVVMAGAHSQTNIAFEMSTFESLAPRYEGRIDARPITVLHVPPTEDVDEEWKRIAAIPRKIRVKKDPIVMWNALRNYVEENEWVGERKIPLHLLLIANIKRELMYDDDTVFK